MDKDEISSLIVQAGNGDEEWTILAKQLLKHFPEELEAFAKLIQERTRKQLEETV